MKGWKVITYKDVEKDNKEKTGMSEHIENSETSEKVGQEQAKTEHSEHTEQTEQVQDYSLFGKQKREIKNTKALPWFDLSAKPYWLRNLFPVLLETAYLIFCFTLPASNLVYITFFFYLALFLFYTITRSLTFRKILINVTSGGKFWKQVIICAVLFGLSLGITALIEYFVPSLDPGFYPLEITNGLAFAVFLVTSLFLAPIVEETFYRGNIISFDTKGILVVTAIGSILLDAISHSFTVWGIISAVIWAIPLTITLIKTKNVYVGMVAHFIVNLFINIPVIIAFIAK